MTLTIELLAEQQAALAAKAYSAASPPKDGARQIDHYVYGVPRRIP